MDIKIVSVDDMQTLEEYGVALLTSISTLLTTHNYHVRAIKLGLLDESEAQFAAVMMDRTQKLLTYYNQQVNLVGGRLPNFEPKEIINNMINITKKE